MRWICGVVLACALGSLALPVADPPQAAGAAQAEVSPPETIPSNCSVDVSHQMQHWLRSLPPDTTVGIAPSACYLVDEGVVLDGARDLTLSGGTWRDDTSPEPGASPKEMNAVFWLVGGSGVTVQNLTIVGANPGGYDPAGAFAAGIRSDGVVGLTVTNVTVDDVYGDGIELAPLRGSDDMSNVIVNPSENVTITNASIDGAGRQGITLASVNGATISGVTLRRIGINVFDVESDQWGEGALNVTINGCTDQGGNGGLFFANGGLSAGSNYTGNITVENCTMATPDAGDAVLVQSPQLEPHPRGLISFVDDSFQCGSSVYVACVMATDARVAVDNSRLAMPAGTLHEPVYRASEESGLTFATDTVSGYGQLGSADATSSVSITGGSWTPYTVAKPPSAPGPTSVPPGHTDLPTPTSTPAPLRSTASTPTPTPTPATAARLVGPALAGATGSRPSTLPSMQDMAAPGVVTLGGVTLRWRLPLLGLSTVLVGLAVLVALRRRRSAAAVQRTPVRPLVDDLLGVGRY
jgi:hypothetical protein